MDYPNLVCSWQTIERLAWVLPEVVGSSKRPAGGIGAKGAYLNVQKPEEKLDTSFEIEERRIRRENIAKDLLLVVARAAQQMELREKHNFLEALRKNSRIYEVQMQYAVQQREAALKAEFLKYFQAAAKKHNFHRRLVKNFARILHRPLQAHTCNVLSHAFGLIKNLKVALYKPQKDVRKSTKPSANQTRFNTSISVVEASKSSPLDTFGGAEAQAIVTPKRQEAGKTPKPKLKIDETKPERANISKIPTGKDQAIRKTELSRDQGKSKEPIKKSAHKPEIQPLKTKELPSKKVLRSTPVKPYSVNSSREDLYTSASKKSQSLASDPKLTSPIKTEHSATKTEQTSSLVPLVDHSNSIMSKHQELKNKLLRQIRGEEGDDIEIVDEHAYVSGVGRPYTEEISKSQPSSLVLIRNSRNPFFHNGQ